MSILEEIGDGTNDAVGVKAVVMEYFEVTAVDDVLVRDAEDAHGNGLLAEHLADHGSKAAETAVLLDGDDAAGLTGSFPDGLLVEGLEPGTVEDSGADALLLQTKRGLLGMPDGLAGGHDGEVIALGDGDSSAGLEDEVIVVVDIGHGGTANTDVARLRTLTIDH